MKHIKDIYGYSLYPKQLAVLHTLEYIYGKSLLEKILDINYDHLIRFAAYMPLPVDFAIKCGILLDGEVEMDDITPLWEKSLQSYRFLQSHSQNQED